MANLGLSQAANNFVNAYTMGKQQKQQQQAQEKTEQVNSLLGGMLMGTATPDQSQQLAQMAPNQFLSAQNYLQGQAATAAAAQDVMNQEEDIADLTYLLSTNDPAAQDDYLKSRIATITERGGDPKETTMLLNMPQEQRSKAIEMLAAQNNIKRPAGDTFEQGTGDMSGYVFNASKGTYEINPELKTQLEEKASAAEDLDVAGVRSINNDVTALSREPIKIRNAAARLDKISESKSATDQLAAVFTFMKALDPSSVVREGEQEMAKRTGGLTDTLLVYIDKLKKGDSLPAPVFDEMVKTAQRISNQAIGDATTEVEGYLNAYGSKLAQDQKTLMLNRMPSQFEVTETPTDTPKFTDDAMSEVDSIMSDLGLNK